MEEGYDFHRILNSDCRQKDHIIQISIHIRIINFSCTRNLNVFLIVYFQWIKVYSFGITTKSRKERNSIGLRSNQVTWREKRCVENYNMK